MSLAAADVNKFQGTRAPNGDIGADLVAALAELQNPLADQRADVPTKTGGRYSYRYAALPDILDAVRPVLGRHSLVLMQWEIQTAPGTVGVMTRLQHASGAYHDFGPLVLPAAGDAQSVGSAITYGRRYALCSVLGIAADEDTDGKPKNVGESTATATRSAEPSPADRRQAGTIAATDAAPASPASSESRSSNQPSGKATVAEDRGSESSEPGFAESTPVDVSGSDQSETEVTGEGASVPDASPEAGGAPAGGVASPALGDDLAGYTLSELMELGTKLANNSKNQFRKWVNDASGTNYKVAEFEQLVTHDELEAGVRRVQQFKKGGG